MKSRIESLQLARHTVFDVLIIGGGITGAAVAQAAAVGGLSVLLVEKSDFAGAASGATNQSFAAGLACLAGLSVSLCRQRRAAVARLVRSAPHLTRPLDFVAPCPKHGHRLPGRSAWLLIVQDLLSWPAHRKYNFARIGWQSMLHAAPALSAEIASAAWQFQDCITDDARLVLCLLAAACQQGALAINYAEARGFEIGAGRIKHIRCRDRFSGEEFAVTAKVVVNAGGAQIDDVCRLADPQWTDKVDSRHSIQIVLPASTLETNVGLCLQDAGGYVLVVPWQHAILIGAADEQPSAAIAEASDAGQEIDRLLETVNRYTNAHQLQRKDIIGTLKGKRPILKEGSALTAKAHREAYAVFDGPCGLINVICAQLADSLPAASAVVAWLQARLTDASIKQDCERAVFGFNSAEEFLTASAEVTALGRKLTLDPATIEHLLANYGAQALVILAMVERDRCLAERILPDYTPILAEIIYSVQHEMAGCLQDFLLRRTRLGVINGNLTLQAAPRVAAIMQQLLDWDQRRVRVELQALEEALRELVAAGAGFQPASKELR